MAKKFFEEVHLTVRVVKPIGMTEIDLRRGLEKAMKSVYKEDVVDAPIKRIKPPTIIGYKYIGKSDGKI